MPYFGNAEIDLEKVLALGRYFSITQGDDMSQLLLLPLSETYTASQVFHIIQLVANLNPDECGLIDNKLRMWWD